jgi:putative transposase
MSSVSPGTTPLFPFWNKHSNLCNKGLWIPSTDNIKVVAKNNFNLSLKKLAFNSWFTVKQSTCITDLEHKVTLPISNDQNTLIDNDFKCKKILLLPDEKQKEILDNWFHDARWTYNQCLASINSKELKIRRKELRKKWLNGLNIKDNFARVLRTPSAIRDGAIDDLRVAFKTNFKSGRQFKINFRSKKAPSESIVIPKKDYKRANVFFPDSFENYNKDSCVIKSAEILPAHLNHDSRLQRTRAGKFYLCILSKIEPRNENQISSTQNIISLDPGVRSFVTGYDTKGNIFEWGKSDINRLFRLGCCADKIKSLIDSDKVNHRTRYNLKKKVLKIFEKIRNLVDTLHKNLAKWLCENYQLILLPEFKTSGMVRRKERKINNKIVRNILTWSHFRFKQRLLSKVREYSQCKVKIVTEEYTSKTCGNCGVIKNNLGSNKVFHCLSCKYKCERDFNGARNILIKYLSKPKINLSKPKINLKLNLNDIFKIKRVILNIQ